MTVAASVIDLPYPEPSGNTVTGPFPVYHGGNLLATLGAFTYFNTGVIRYWYLNDPTASPFGFDWEANRDAYCR